MTDFHFLRSSLECPSIWGDQSSHPSCRDGPGQAVEGEGEARNCLEGNWDPDLSQGTQT